MIFRTDTNDLSDGYAFSFRRTLMIVLTDVNDLGEGRNAAVEGV